MSFLEDESSENGRTGRTKMESFFFSCELSSQVPFYTFQGDEEESLEQYLDLRTICLGSGAKEESNVVEVTALNHRGKKVSVPVANLHISCLPMVSMGEFEVKTPVTFRLKSGSGPVCVSGLHLIAFEDDEDDDESDVSEDMEEIDDDIIPIKPAKKKQQL
ncbi:nucleoplasmin-like protein NO29 [Megalops cyprinoides]|uniref:nucleoplasmin-like protein NO29 n=1 Tax=Megalops cyprinoides TaxID=118141 RepID=UPI0018640A68|nr:nucleoplasmin-like protein NO29 [Megalops cyprinoides]